MVDARIKLKKMAIPPRVGVAGFSDEDRIPGLSQRFNLAITPTTILTLKSEKKSDIKKLVIMRIYTGMIIVNQIIDSLEFYLNGKYILFFSFPLFHQESGALSSVFDINLEFTADSGASYNTFLTVISDKGGEGNEVAVIKGT